MRVIIDPFQYYKEYFDCTDDNHSHIYEIASSPYESHVMGSSLFFGPDKYPLTIIDQFSGKRPAIINRAFLTSKGKYNMIIVATMLLDSHVATHLHLYRTGGKSDYRETIEAFLTFVSKHGYDYNPIFYFLESYSKSSLKEFLDNVAPIATSLLFFHSMDEARFVSSKEMILKADAIEYYYSLYGADSLEKCGKAMAESFSADVKNRDYLQIIDASYACLLKMVLIQKRNSDRPVHKKLEELNEFMISELGATMVRERHLAIYYFAGLAGSFIGVQANMNVDKAKHDLKATAWDIFLLRLPELFLDPAQLPEMNLTYVCTVEKKLIKLGELLKIERLFAKSADDFDIMPEISIDLSLLERTVSRESLSAITENSHQAVDHVPLRKKVQPINAAQMNFVIQDLEIQLSYLCGR